MTKVLILDNGAHTIKAGLFDFNPHFDQSTLKFPKLFPNAATTNKTKQVTSHNTSTQLYADQIEDLEFYSSVKLRRPYEKGLLMNDSLQMNIWDRIFSEDVLNVDENLNQTTLFLTETPLNLPPITDKLDEIVFEKYGFIAQCRGQSAPLALQGYEPQASCSSVSSLSKRCALVVDSGFSYQHVIPVFDGTPLNYAVRRIDIGGKILTNQLIEQISFRRELNVKDEFLTIDSCKIKCCYVSQNFEDELLKYKTKRNNPLQTRFVLPNGTTRKRHGYVINGPDDPGVKLVPGEDQYVTMKNERICVPELLFHPSDINVKQAGLAETIVNSIEACPKEFHQLLQSNILICGGNVLFKNFSQRLEKELRYLAPNDLCINIFCDKDPITTAQRGARNILMNFGSSVEDFQRDYCVTKAEYEEAGSQYCSRKFSVVSFQ